jgi:hypothetical protein
MTHHIQCMHPSFFFHQCKPVARIAVPKHLELRREVLDNLAGLDGGSGVDAVLGWALGNGLGLAAGLGSLEFLADGLDAGGTGSGDGSSS